MITYKSILNVELLKSWKKSCAIRKCYWTYKLKGNECILLERNKKSTTSRRKISHKMSSHPGVQENLWGSGLELGMRTLNSILICDHSVAQPLGF